MGRQKRHRGGEYSRAQEHGGAGGIVNEHSTDVESTNIRNLALSEGQGDNACAMVSAFVAPHDPGACVYMSISPEGESCSDLGSSVCSQ